MRTNLCNRKYFASPDNLAKLLGQPTETTCRQRAAERLELQTDVTYAVKVIARCAVTLTSILLACIPFSVIAWVTFSGGSLPSASARRSDCGRSSRILCPDLIVLAERSICIGDAVTVGGGISGIVLRVHA